MDWDRLIHLREQKKLTRAQVAADLKVSPSTYGKWELGQRKPDTDTVINIANYFGVSADYLLGISNEPHPYSSKHYTIENGDYIERSYSEKTGKNAIKKIASIEMTPMEIAIAFFHAQKGRYPTDEELEMFMAFTKPVLDSLPDKED